MISEKRLAVHHVTSDCCSDPPARHGNLSDEDLMDLIKRGNHAAFAELFDRYHRLVLSAVTGMLRDRGEAEDMMQEVFFDIYRKAAQFDPAKGKAKRWIMQCAHNRSVNRLQYLSARRFYDTDEVTGLEVPGPNGATTSWNGLSFRDWARIIEEGLGSLSSKQRETLEKACYEGQSLREIAELMNEPLGNVRNHYYRGLKRLRDFLKEKSCFEVEPVISPEQLIGTEAVDVES